MNSPENILIELNHVFQIVFSNKNIIVKPETTAADIKEWDSLNHMYLITEIETHFNCEFSFDEVINFKNVSDIIITIQNKKS